MSVIICINVYAAVVASIIMAIISSIVIYHRIRFLSTIHHPPSIAGWMAVLSLNADSNRRVELD